MRATQPARRPIPSIRNMRLQASDRADARARLTLADLVPDVALVRSSTELLPRPGRGSGVSFTPEAPAIQHLNTSLDIHNRQLCSDGPVRREVPSCPLPPQRLP